MADATPEMLAARERMIARRFGGGSGANSRTGGRGSVRRKRKTQHKTATSDDKKLSSTLKKLGVTNIPGIEEVNLFKNDGNVIHFRAPKVQASIAANTYVVSGNSETKPLNELLPGILNQLGQESMQQLKTLMEQMGPGGLGGMPGMGGMPAGMPAMPAGADDLDDDDDDDDDVPELEENFEDVSNQK